jgi:hypothetical protein
MNLSLLKKRCLSSEESFSDVGRVIETKDGPLIFKDNGASVLAVAHLDSVITRPAFRVESTKNGVAVYNPELDDRLGVHVILDMLPTMGIKTDILLTTGEEIGFSTGYWFDQPRQYNWIFSFDRVGTDMVMYNYETAELVNTMIDSYGYRVGMGSFSDISFMEHLECKGFNFGVGYEDYHSDRAHFFPSVTERCVRRFARFYQDYKDVKLPHKESIYSLLKPNETYFALDFEICDYCGRESERAYFHSTLDAILCDSCYEYYVSGDFV